MFLIDLHHLSIPSRGVCWMWNWNLLIPYIIGNFLIATAYFHIPLSFWRLARARKGMWLTPQIAVYGLFILFCGGGHLLTIFLIWWAGYWFTVPWDFLTGIVSWIAAIQTKHRLEYLKNLPDAKEVSDLMRAIRTERDHIVEESSSPDGPATSTNSLSQSGEHTVKLLNQTLVVLDGVLALTPKGSEKAS